jgi:surface protein
MASNKRFLKAYARFDGSGRIVPSSTILRKNKPKVGSWKEVQTYLCCNYEPVPFISVWRTTESDESISLPYSSDGTYSGIIDWGDGTTSPNSYANRTHTYATAGDYTITITGTIVSWSFGGSTFEFDPNAPKIRSVVQWGNLQLGNEGGYFVGCTNLDLSAVADVLNLTGTTNLRLMFAACQSLTTINRIDEWDVSNVTNMSGMFANEGVMQFNQNIGMWDVSSVTNMFTMFASSTAFNNGGSSSINNWNVSNVTNMSSMFSGASAFNQNIGNWDVSSVTNMGNMFANATSFNQNLSTWCVSLIPSLPSGFDTGATAWVLPKPVWGTCP